MSVEFWSDVTIPVCAILVPTGIALLLARNEMKAAETVRLKAEAQRENERVSLGVDAALECMDALVEAAYEDDFRAAARVRMRAAHRLNHIQHNLGDDNEAVWEWIREELTTVADGLEDKSDLGLPMLVQEIVYRGAEFTEVMSAWRRGKVGNEWFAAVSHASLGDTPKPTEEPVTHRS